MAGRESRSFNRRDFPQFPATLIAGFSKYPALVVDHSKEGVGVLSDYDPFKHERKRGDYSRGHNHKEPQGDTTRNVILLLHKDERVGFCPASKNNEDYCAISDDAQSFHGRLRKSLVLSYEPPYLEGLIEPHEKRNGPGVRISQKGILEINLKGRRM